MNARGIDFTGIAYLVGIGVVGFVAYQVIANKKAIVTAFNPASDQNVAYKGANAVTRAVTGNNVDTLGTWLAGIFSPAVRAANRAVYNPPAGPAALTQTQLTWDQQLRGRTNDGARAGKPIVPAYQRNFLLGVGGA